MLTIKMMFYVFLVGVFLVGVYRQSQINRVCGMPIKFE